MSKRLIWVVALLSFVALNVFSAVPSDKELNKILQLYFDNGNITSGLSPQKESVWPLEFYLEKKRKTKPAIDEFVNNISAKFQIEEQSVRPWLTAYLAVQNLDLEYYQGDGLPKNLTVIQALFQEATNKSGGNEVILKYMLRFYRDYLAYDKSFEKELVQSINRASNPTDTAIELAETTYSYDRGGVLALYAAYSRQPEDLVLAIRLMESALDHGYDTVAAAVGEISLASIPTSSTADYRKKRVVISALLIKALSEIGDSSRMLEIYSSFPDELQKELVYGHEIQETFTEGNNSIVITMVLPGPEIALAASMEGQNDVSKSMVSKIRSATSNFCMLMAWDVGNETKKSQLAFKLDTIQRFNDRPEKDPFDFMVQVVNETDHWSGLLWDKALGQYADSEGYGVVKRSIWARTREYYEQKLKEFGRDDELISGQLNIQVQKYLTVLKTELRNLDQISIPTVVPEVEDKMHNNIIAELSRPPLKAYIEKRIPQGASRSKGIKNKPHKMQQDEDNGDIFPKEYKLVRIDKYENLVLAIALSQDLDPVGEISGGGYWLLRFDKDRENLLPPLYLGVRMYQPYVVKNDSNLPLISGDRLQVEVEIQELDENSVTFPPLYLAAKRVEKGLYLEFLLDELSKDSDSDGLTDLVEDRILTNPNIKDTDGDGVNDKDDSLPLVPVDFNMPYFPENLALSAALHWSCFEKPAAIITGLTQINENFEERMKRVMNGDGAGLSGDRVTYVESNRSYFSLLLPSERSIILHPEEVNEARKKFGVFYPLRIEQFFLDRKKERGIIMWDAGWSGATVLLEKKNGVWTTNLIKSWIT